MKQRGCYWDTMVITEIIRNLKVMKGSRITGMIVLLGLLIGCNGPGVVWEKDSGGFPPINWVFTFPTT